MSILKRIFHRPDTEAEEKLEHEITENEKKRRELNKRLTAIEATLPVRPRGRHNAG